METAGNSHSTHVAQAGVNEPAVGGVQTEGSLGGQSLGVVNVAIGQRGETVMAGAGAGNGVSEPLHGGNADFVQRPAQQPRRSGCRDIGVYEQMHQIGEGTYGYVQ